MVRVLGKRPRGYNTRSRWLPNAIAAANVIGTAYQAYKSRPQTMTEQQRRRKYQTSGIGITNEHDRQRVYSKKRMPYRRKKRWRSFTRKIQYISEKELGSRTVVFSRGYTTANQTLGQQMLSTLALYPQSSTTTHLNDLKAISTIENALDPTVARDVTIDDTTKIFFQSAVFDLTLRNSSQINIGTEAVPNWTTSADATLEIDIYEIISPRQFINEQDLFECFNLSSGKTKKVADASAIGASVEIELRGVTPWDLPQALSTYRLKILRKTKYRISNGNTITYQMRDPRRHVTNIGRIKDQTGCNRPGWTKFIFIISKLVPGLTHGPGAGQYRPRMDFGVTRKYMYKLEGANMTRDLYVAQT